MRQLLFVFVVCGTLQAAAVRVDIASAGNSSARQQYVLDRGVYIGPYTLDVNGVTSLGLCVDFQRSSEVGESWKSFQTPIAPTGMNYSYVYQENKKRPNVDAITFQTYEEEAFLYHQIVSTLLPDDRIAMQDAAWSITDSGFDISNNPAALLWVAAARNPGNYQHVDLTGIFVFSDVKGSKRGAQEFMIDPGKMGSPYTDPISSVPEPRSLWPFAATIFLGLMWRRRRT